MISVRRSDERGHFDFGWLDTRHTFSFGDYHDPRFMGFRDLRVINEDWVRPGQGFGRHPHRDMEIVTYVLEGSIHHADSMGTSSTIRPGEVQRMTAGRGVTHSEANASQTEDLHLMQVWILPERTGLDPSYEQRAFPDDERRGRLRVVASRDGRDGSLTIHQDASMLVGLLARGQSVEHRFEPTRAGWLQVLRGEVAAGGERLAAGDGLAVSDEAALSIRSESEEDAEVMLFDLA